MNVELICGVIGIFWALCVVGVFALLIWAISCAPVRIEENPREQRLRLLEEEIERDYRDYFEGNIPRESR